MAGEHSGDAPTSEEVQAEATAWLEANWDPALTVRAWWAKLAESGWSQPQWPVEWFGRGLPASSVGGVREAFVTAGALGPPTSLGHALGGPTLLTHADDGQKARFLPGLATGEEAWCQCFSEPGSGSDLASAQTRAVRDGDEYIVNGQKVWTSGAQYADRGMLVARTNPDAPKHRGLTYFIIDIDQPGIEVRPLHQMNGADHFNEVFFTDARVSADRIIGAENEGWAVAVTTLMFERFSTGFGVAAGKKSGHLEGNAGEVAVEMAKAVQPRRANPALLALNAARSSGTFENPVIRQAVTAAWATSEVDRLSKLRSAAAVRAGSPPGSTGSIGKLTRTRINRSAAHAGMAAIGTEGLLVGPDTVLSGAVQELSLSTPSTSIAGGTDEIQRNIVGERVLGLPKEPAVDRDVPFRDLRVGTQPSGRRP